LWAAALCLAACSAVRAQDLAPAPDYSDSGVIEGSEQASNAWKTWMRGDRDLEKDVLAASMSDARDRVQRSFSALLVFVDKRRIYGERVASYIELYRPETAGRKPVVTLESVNRDQIQLLGLTLSLVQSRLDALRDTPVWVTVRRAVQADRSDILALQGSRREEIPIDLPLSGPSARPMPWIRNPVRSPW
jgi:hypothetical protein